MNSTEAKGLLQSFLGFAPNMETRLHAAAKGSPTQECPMCHMSPSNIKLLASAIRTLFPEMK